MVLAHYMKTSASPFLMKFAYLSVFAGVFSLSFIGCSPTPQPAADKGESSASTVASEVQAKQDHGKKLTQVAGQATLPNDDEIKSAPVPEHAKIFIGRFHAKVKCDDSFIPCPEGDAEFILNLLPDGTVHRSIIQIGKVFAEKTNTPGINVKYRKDTWSVNEAHTELVVHRKEGVNFYYHVINENKITMDLDKIRQGEVDRNQELFSKGYPQPQHAYTLVKDPN